MGDRSAAARARRRVGRQPPPCPPRRGRQGRSPRAHHGAVPFLPPAGISEPLLASLDRLLAGFAAFEFTLDQVGWFGEDVVWLGPRDPAPFSALTSAAFIAFPCCPPYGGQHDEVIPHLTIGHAGGQQALRAAAESVRPCLPIEATAADVILMAGPRPGTPDTPPGQWRTVAAFPLG